mmetsp:Transcript_48319/g.54067  ORF Transcript_48319/g.54067 Transcript_48319/m.54067 type:complete len:93 (-) Transcript_48319:482-760(-)
MSKENNLYQFKDFIGCDKQILLDIKRQKHNISTPYNSLKIKMIHDVLLCYHFMRKNNDKVIVENPDHWVMEDFKDWRVNGYPTSTAVGTSGN